MKTRHEKKITQADNLMKDWAGRNPDKTLIGGTKPSKSGFRARMILAQSEPFKSNPEYALGCARLCLTYNIMTPKDLSWMLNNHPAWSQLMRPENMDVNNLLMDEAKNSDWGKTHNVTATLEVKGNVEITYEHPQKGVKTENVALGFEMIRYEGDTRPFIALNLGGGSAIRYHLLKTEPDRPDYKVNDDSNTRRYVKTGRHVKAEADTLLLVEKELDARADDVLARLLRGENVNLGLDSIDESDNDDDDSDDDSRRGAPAAFRKR